MFILKFAVLTIFSIITLTEAAQKSCCGDDYLNFTGINCVASDFHEYLPALKCDKYVLLEEAIDDEFDDGTACNVNFTVDDGLTETLTLVCEEEHVQPFILYLFPVSMVFLLLTIGVYLKTNSYKLGQDVAIIIICVCLTTVLVIRVMFLLNLDSDTFYALDEYVGKFALIAYFAWLNILMAHCLTKLMYDKDSQLSCTATHLYGWTIPAFVIYLSHTKAFGDYSNDYLLREWYYKYLPITILWCINLALYTILTFHIIARNVKACPSTQMQSGCWQFLRLVLLASIWFTWLFEILSAKYPDTIPHVWFVMDVINALHGVIVFVVMVICRKTIFSKLMGRSQNWSTLNNSCEDVSQKYLVHNLNNVVLTISQNIDLYKK